MSASKIIGTVLLVAGIVLLIISAAADIIGFGKDPSFGYAQITGVVAGAIVAIVGFVLLLKKKTPVSNS